MTAAERLLWNRIHRRASGLTPELATAILRAFRVIADSMSEAEMIRAVQLGSVDRLYDEAVANAAYAPVRERIRESVQQGVKYYARDVPGGGKVEGTLAIGFDILDPRVIEAIRALESKVITTLDRSIRETVRGAVEAGLQAGTAPRTVARGLRQVIGLAPNQEEAVRNFRKALSGEGRNPLDYKLRDKRFDATIRKGPLSPEQIDRMVEAYRKRMLAFNAATNAKTAALDAQRLSQRMSWQDAIAKGIVKPDRLWKRRAVVLDGRERPEHHAMNGEEQPFNAPYSNGELVSGDLSYNCRCLDIYFQRTA